jgi:hypothetical protein
VPGVSVEAGLDEERFHPRNMGKVIPRIENRRLRKIQTQLGVFACDTPDWRGRKTTKGEGGLFFEEAGRHQRYRPGRVPLAAGCGDSDVIRRV